ncbi:methionyl-tRNA formyltransferase [Stella humosa]|uniref:Methionyl-tRNA formyltransferase n=1 Tax=Stella humosa TaxID=94 RepID=A0A3N1KWR4_9PROT|nr:methionyl-tRNA formyltransferase [Stella humosa]ROP84314.1 methionyl-tRNA formyltransferase [Stella humosa]BBK33828.1 methionyl-tRNA formyltransferase [Stella humosa]
MPGRSPLRLIFMGSPGFAVPVLDALLAAGHQVAACYSQPPKPANRGQRLSPCPVHAHAEALGIPVLTPRSLRGADAQAEFAAIRADAAVVAAYGLILPAAVLAAPRLGCINVHASLLPRWRGAAPIQRAILAGDAESGVTIMQMDAGLDTGAMLLAGRVPIRATTTASTLHDALAALGSRLIVEALDGLAAGAIQAVPQPTDGITYAAKLDRAEARIDWRADAEAIDRQVRAFDPWPGTWFELGPDRIRVLAGEVVPDRQEAPGTVLDTHLTVACGSHAYRPTRVQRPGRAATDTDAMLRGFPIAPGTVLAAA